VAASAELYTLITVQQHGVTAQVPVTIDVTITDDGRAMGCVTHTSDPTRTEPYTVEVAAMQAFLDAVWAVAFPQRPPGTTASHTPIPAGRRRSRGSSSVAGWPGDPTRPLRSPVPHSSTRCRQ
jgi:hypothetical protein